MSSSTNRIVLVGASVRAAAESAARAGFCVFGSDLFHDSDTQAVCDSLLKVPATDDAFDSFCRACAETDVICVGEFSTDASSSSSTMDKVLQRLSENSLVLGPTTDVRNRLRYCVFLRELAQQSGMNVPFTLTSEDSTCAAVERGNQWLIKREHSSGGLGVRWSKEMSLDSRPMKLNLDEGERLQQWIPGKSIGATLLSDGDQVILLGACRSLFTRCGDFPFVYAGNYGPVGLSQSVNDRLRKLGGNLVRRTGLTGLFNVDTVVDPSGELWLLEVNPRWSGSVELIERRLIESQRLGPRQPSPRKSLLSVVIAVMRGEAKCGSFLDLAIPCRPNGSRYLKRVVYARRDFIFQPDGLMNSLVEGESVHDLPISGTAINRGDPVMTYMMDQKKTGSIANYRARLKILHRVIGSPD